MVEGMEDNPIQSFWDMTPVEFAAWAKDAGAPAFRARQVQSAVYHQGAASLDEITVLPRALREEWRSRLDVSVPEIVQTRGGVGEGAKKFLLRLSDGQTIEIVRIYEPYGDTLCLSSQVGCALGCQFCATGTMGLRRDLSAGEIAAQVAVAARDGGLPQHYVYMGMGEPFQNYDAVVKSLRILTDPAALGISARRITISTAGMAPEMYRFADEGLPITLAVSIGGSTQEERARLIPLGHVYTLPDVVAAARHSAKTTGRRVSYEYLLLEGETDKGKDAERLAEMLSGDLCHVNLLHFNRVPDLPFRPSGKNAREAFRDRLAAARIPVTLRRSKGEKIFAACGQLARRDGPSRTPREKGASS